MSGSKYADQSCAPGRRNDQACRLGAVLVRPATDLRVSMRTHSASPPGMLHMDLDPIRNKVRAAISPLRPAGLESAAPDNFLFDAKRTDAGRQLPAYYLVYFLLVDLLGFKNLGQFDKVAWSVPVDFQGRAFLIEHRKFGLGVFAPELPDSEAIAAEIVRLIQNAVKLAEPYFDWRAEQAVCASKLNVINKTKDLFERFRFFADQYDAKRAEAERRADERVETRRAGGYDVHFPTFGLRRESRWLALSAIESFFSWTEHVFILLAILRGNVVTGDAVAKLAAQNWDVKFKAALDVNDPETKRYYDDLIIVRRQLRNFVAHGSFGKQGEAFLFHSSAGAVPVRLPHHQGASFRFGSGIDFVDHEAITLLLTFVSHLWSGSRSPARIYLQEYGLPLILTMAQKGEYARAMASEDDMAAFAHHLAAVMDRHADMDF